jgi:hypothetical protein
MGGKSERRPFSCVSYWYFLMKEFSKMDRRDQKLLDKQLRRINPAPRNDGVIAFAVLAVFFAGMAFGGFMFAYKSEPIQIASNDATPAAVLSSGALPATRH